MNYTLETMLATYKRNKSLITVVGAGGKTSFIKWLAEHYSALGKRVIIAPSTKICAGEQNKQNVKKQATSLVLESECDDLVKAVRAALSQDNKPPVVTVCAQLDSQKKKYVGLNSEKITRLKQIGLADIVLCEGDGAARKALKAPAEHEPVIPEETDFCVGFMGLDTLNMPLNEENVHRATLFSKITDLPLEQEIHFEHFVRLALAEQGLFKNVAHDKIKAVFLNKFDTIQNLGTLQLWRQALDNTPRNIIWWYGSVRAKMCELL